MNKWSAYNFSVVSDDAVLLPLLGRGPPGGRSERVRGQPVHQRIWVSEKIVEGEIK